MTIAVLSDAPTLTTGFGVTTRRIVDALHAAGWDVACFGLKARPDDTVDQSQHFIWPAERGGHWTQSLRQFFATVQPKLLLLNMDAYNAVECLDAVRSAGYRGLVASYVVFDGLPVGRHYLAAQRSCTAVLVSSHTAAAYLCANGLEVAGVAPPGVDGDVFAPSPDAFALRSRAGLGDAAVIGVFGTNTERKQIPRVLSAMPSIKDRLGPSRVVVLYLHCRPTGYWRLAEMADEMGLREHVRFPTTSGFDEKRGTWEGRARPSRTKWRSPAHFPLNCPMWTASTAVMLSSTFRTAETSSRSSSRHRRAGCPSFTPTTKGSWRRPSGLAVCCCRHVTSGLAGAVSASTTSPQPT